MSQSHRVLPLDELEEGTAKTANVAGVQLALVRTGGEVHALDNICPHAGGPLGDGPVDGDHVICPWHGWRFHVKTGACEYAPGLTQRRYPVTIEDDAIHVTLGE